MNASHRPSPPGATAPEEVSPGPTQAGPGNIVKTAYPRCAFDGERDDACITCGVGSYVLVAATHCQVVARSAGRCLCRRRGRPALGRMERIGRNNPAAPNLDLYAVHRAV